MRVCVCVRVWCVRACVCVSSHLYYIALFNNTNCNKARVCECVVCGVCVWCVCVCVCERDGV